MTTPPTNFIQPSSSNARLVSFSAKLHKLTSDIVRFFYRNGANSKSFKLMIDAIGMYGVHLKYNQIFQDLVL